MRILVVGDGKVGHTLAEHLAREGHDVVIVDRSEEVLQRSEDTLDVLCVRGNGANAATLVDAGADKADIIIAATASDETNMLCCLVAKKLGTKYSIARIRDPEYNDSLTLLQRVPPRWKSAGCCAFPLPATSNPLPRGGWRWWSSARRSTMWWWATR